MSPTEGSAATSPAWFSAPAERLLSADICGTRVSPAETPARHDALQVPIIDLQEDEATAAKRLYDACTTYGFLYVRNHGVDEGLIQQQFEQNAKFFALPLADKLAIKANKSNRGYFPFGEGTAKNPYAQLDRKEALNLYLGWESEDVDVPFHGRNLWPSTESLPEYRRVLTEYNTALTGVADRLLRLIALSLGLPSNFWQDKFDRPTANIRAVHYLPGAHDASQGVFGVGAHTDWGMLTVLATDTVPGLQIYVDGQWIDVEPKPGHFVVNIGDMLDRWTNGRFKSTLHRVVKTTNAERLSTPFFLAPNWDAQVEVLKVCCSVTDPPKFPPTTCGDWLMMRRDAEYGSEKKLVVG